MKTIQVLTQKEVEEVISQVSNQYTLEEIAHKLNTFFESKLGEDRITAYKLRKFQAIEITRDICDLEAMQILKELKEQLISKFESEFNAKCLLLTNPDLGVGFKFFI